MRPPGSASLRMCSVPPSHLPPRGAFPSPLFLLPLGGTADRPAPSEDFPARPARPGEAYPGGPHSLLGVRTASSAGAACGGLAGEARTAARVLGRHAHPGTGGEESPSSPGPCPPRGTGWGQGEEVSPPGGLVPDSPRGLPGAPRPGPPSAGVALGNVARTPRKGLARLLPGQGGRAPAGDVGPARSVLTGAAPRARGPGGRHAAPGPFQGAAGRASASCTGPPAATSPGPRPAPPGRPPGGGAGAGPARGRGGPSGAGGAAGVCPAPRPAPRAGLGLGSGELMGGRSWGPAVPGARVHSCAHRACAQGDFSHFGAWRATAKLALGSEPRGRGVGVGEGRNAAFKKDLAARPP